MPLSSLIPDKYNVGSYTIAENSLFTHISLKSKIKNPFGNQNPLSI
jgi:hypothetical protein